MPRILSFTRVALLLAVFALFTLMNAPLGVVAHHDNEAEHDEQAAVSVGVTASDGGAPVDLPPTTSAKPAKSTQKMASAPSDLVIETIFIPDNATSLRKATKGDKVTVHYTGTLFTTGAKFDSSVDRNKPFAVTLGVGQVIRGWDEGIDGMVVGEKRKLTIPPNKAYGERGFGSVIPANSTLVFVVELLGVVPGHGDL